jgi:hypothetical protein
MQVLRRALRAALIVVRHRASVPLLAALALAGCAANAEITASLPYTGPRTLAFESIDGPPRPVFDRVVNALRTEAEKRDLPVVSHTGPAAYRVRAYLAASSEKKKKQAAISWAWEVFDERSKRAFRISGEEPVGKAGRDVWTQCDDATLARIAAKGFDALTERLALPPVAQVSAYSASNNQ